MKQLIAPSGFIEHHNHNQTWWTKAEWVHFFPGHCNPFHTTSRPPPAILTGGGRGASYRVDLNNGAHAIVRPYRRGGFVRHFVREWYWDRPFRPFRELLCTEHARQCGIPTVEVLAASVEQRTLGFYRGVFITREADGFVNLWEWLQRRPLDSQRTAVFITVIQTIGQLSQIGIRHADLNLTNILVCAENSPLAVRIIDFDRARIFPDPLSPHQHQRVLQRLRRSFLKLDPTRVFHSLAEEDFLCNQQA
jgi:serine/threonine protein kinase